MSTPTHPIPADEQLARLRRYRKDIEHYRDLQQEAFDRSINLLKASAKLPEVSDDLTRALVVMSHAYLEDFLRTLAVKLLPLADEETLDQVPLVGCEKGKFFLGKLAQHRGKTVDDVLRESVTEHLERSNFSSTNQIVSLIESCLGQKLDPPAAAMLPTLEKMIERRHNIVHRADRTISVDGGKTQLQAIDQDKVADWLATTQNFISRIVWSLLNKEFPAKFQEPPPSLS